MSIMPTLQQLQEKGFPMGGEPSVAVDLIDTLMKAVDPPVDLLEGRAEAWWNLESVRLPDDTVAEAVQTRRLRAALREAIEARVDDRPVDPSAIDDLNHFADSVPSSPRLVVSDEGVSVTTRWHPEHGGNTNLAAIARDGIALLADPQRSGRLRRCANPECSMIFLAENSRRIWCTPNICGNRTRVARHYQRTHND
jgi:predicted RNA-binding Zn ribbon-like protein